MLDLLYIGITLLFFAVSIAMVKGLDLLLGADHD
jgi:hypothetical protein